MYIWGRLENSLQNSLRTYYLNIYYIFFQILPQLLRRQQDNPHILLDQQHHILDTQPNRQPDQPPPQGEQQQLEDQFLVQSLRVILAKQVNIAKVVIIPSMKNVITSIFVLTIRNYHSNVDLVNSGMMRRKIVIGLKM